MISRAAEISASREKVGCCARAGSVKKTRRKVATTPRNDLEFCIFIRFEIRLRNVLSRGPLCVSVCAQCLCGENSHAKTHHRGTEISLRHREKRNLVHWPNTPWSGNIGTKRVKPPHSKAFL